MADVGIAGRLGHVLYWFGLSIAILAVVAGVFAFFNSRPSEAVWIGGALVCAGVLSYALGLAFRYILAGPKPKRASEAPRTPWGKSLAQGVVMVAAMALTAGGVRYGTETVRQNATGLTGAVRVEYVKAAIATCNKQQRALIENVSLSNAQLQTYCSCYADETADNLSLADLKLMDTATPQQIWEAKKPLIEKAGDKCASAMK